MDAEQHYDGTSYQTANLDVVLILPHCIHNNKLDTISKQVEPHHDDHDDVPSVEHNETKQWHQSCQHGPIPL